MLNYMELNGNNYEKVNLKMTAYEEWVRKVQQK